MSEARGQYTIAETLYTSVAWSVFRATSADGQPVRITSFKVPSGLPTVDLDQLASLMESAATSRPAQGLMRVLDGGLTDGVIWLAESAPTGPSIRDAVAASGPMEADRVVPFLHQIAAALEPLHAAGESHVWLSPDNVYLEPAALIGGQVWGRALALLSHVTQKAVWPEPEYVAPEIRSGAPLNASAEVFSAAALVAYASTGQLPSARRFEGFPTALQTALNRALASTPETRYGAVKEMAVDVTVEQAIAMQDAAEQSAVPAGGEVPDWARALLLETAARRDAGQPLVDAAPAPDGPAAAPVSRTGLPGHGAPTEPAASAAGRPLPPPAPVAAPVPAASIPAAPVSTTPVSPASPGHAEALQKDRRDRSAEPAKPTEPAFNWSQPDRPRSWLPALVVAVSVLFILAAIALTVMKK